jgi:hypothetical protein
MGLGENSTATSKTSAEKARADGHYKFKSKFNDDEPARRRRYKFKATTKATMMAHVAACFSHRQE